MQIRLVGRYVCTYKTQLLRSEQARPHFCLSVMWRALNTTCWLHSLQQGDTQSPVSPTSLHLHTQSNTSRPSKHSHMVKSPPSLSLEKLKASHKCRVQLWGHPTPLSTERLLCFNLTPWLVCKPVSPACRSAAELGPHLCGEVALMKPHSSTSVNKSWANHRHTSCPADF